MSNPKLQRWIDLLAALLAHRMPVTFKELAKDIPAYLADGSVTDGQPSATLKRMFERDKAELLEQGVPILTIGEEGSEESAYQLRTKDFYLPYLGVISARGTSNPPKVDRYGYHSLQTLAFEPDELEAIVEGAKRVAQAGDPAFAADVRSALHKLAFDLPLGATDGTADAMLVPPTHRADPQVLATLGDALFHRKRVTFRYHGMGAEKASARTAEPYGLFFLSGHWYLIARDTAKDALRNFRVSRIAEVRTGKSAKSDYAIPPDFSLRDHAKSRQAWEIGDGDAFEAAVEFSGHTGAAIAAAALGRSDASSPTLRRFDVRRTDSFTRWLLVLAGEAAPLSPPALVEEYASLVRQTRALYESHHG
jgi:proteasome accessory factor B